MAELLPNAGICRFIGGAKEAQKFQSLMLHKAVRGDRIRLMAYTFDREEFTSELCKAKARGADEWLFTATGIVQFQN